ncbi:MAG: SRPBCC family protein [Flammeovirgaceae bacterium]
MEQKTKIQAEDGKQEIFITREFDLPVELLFKAYIEREFVEQWMGTKVLTLESKKQGAYRFETTDTNGNILLQSSGVIHDLILNEKITRTFEMENTPFPVQLEYLEFEKLTDQTSKLNMQVVYKSVADRDAILKLPFAFGINMAHNKLQEILNKVK